MPKKKTFERDLIDIKITRRCHEYLLQIKQRGQPIYHLVDGIVGAYKDDEVARIWEERYNEQIEITKRWKEKYERIKDGINLTVDNFMKNFSGSEENADV